MATKFVTWLAGLTAKSTPTDTDQMYVGDTGTSKVTTWANVKATLKTYFDTLYQPLATNLTAWAALATSAKQDALVSGTNLKTVNSTSLLGSGDVAVQATLVSGTNIKTVNSSSLLGSGDLTVSATPGGSTTQVQYNNAGAFAGSANFTYTNAVSNTPSLYLVNGVDTMSIGPNGNYNGKIVTNYSLWIESTSGSGTVFGGGSPATSTPSLSNQNGCAIFRNAFIFARHAGYASSTAYTCFMEIAAHQADHAIVPLVVRGQAAYPSAATHIVGGSVQITGGLGASSSAGAANGGNVVLAGGTGYGTGHAGYIIMSNLPTSAAGLPSGAIWNNGGVLNIA